MERGIVKALLQQRKDNAEAARQLAAEEARDRLVCCEMNGTAVEITSDSGSSAQATDLSGAVRVTDLAEMVVHVTDAETRKAASLVVGRVDLGRVWALYTSEFKHSLKLTSPTEVFNDLKARKKLLLFMSHYCLELFLSRQSGFMKLTLKDLCQYVASVEVRVVSARDLVNADAVMVLGGRLDRLLGGKSDPYVVARLGGERAKTTTKKNTLNPDFDELFSLKWKHHKEVGGGELQFDVMDKDLLSKDGACLVLLHPSYLPPACFMI